MYEDQARSQFVINDFVIKEENQPELDLNKDQT